MSAPVQVLPDGGVLFGYDYTHYMKAIEEAPAGTVYMLGDELPSMRLMRCTDCGAEMDEVLTPSHVCPMQECKACHRKYDASKVSHVPIEKEETRGMLTIRTTEGCKEVGRA